MSGSASFQRVRKSFRRRAARPSASLVNTRDDASAGKCGLEALPGVRLLLPYLKTEESPVFATGLQLLTKMFGQSREPGFAFRLGGRVQN
jgi:hypothetical protein